jgi:hypothetical protein
MILDKWLAGEIISISFDMVEQALNELELVGDEIGRLAKEGQNWEAYTRLTDCLSFFNRAAAQLPDRRHGIIERLLDWIQRIRNAMDQIVSGVGGNGYSIGISIPFGLSLSISFPI